MISRTPLAAAAVLTAAAAHAADHRTIDGTLNNPNNPFAGSVGQTIHRAAGADYLDGVGAVDPNRPNARVISNTIFNQTAPDLSARNLSEMTWVWGQFLDHDIDHTLFDADQFGSLSITIPDGDPFFDNGSTNLGGQQIHVSRSEFADGTGVNTPRQQVNNITSWIDASNVYGGRATDHGPTRHEWLRTFNGGKLKTSDSPHGDMLPRWNDAAPEMDNTARPTMGTNAYVAGDVRANEQPALIGMHTVFVREHNRLADAIANADPSLSDEQIYQRARKIVGAQLQHITYNEYLPALGIDLDPYTGYNPSEDPSIASEFSTAAFRFGHSQVTGEFERLDANGQVVPQGNLSLADSFFNPATFAETGVEPFLRGLASSTQQEIDTKVIGELRNQLFQAFVPGVGLVDNATDLVAVNIMRGRDHGLQDYNTVRQSYGLAPANSFADITTDPEIQAAFAAVYDSPNELDIFVGALAEDHLPGASVGQLTAEIIADQFQRLRDADRFWHTNDPTGVNADLHDLTLDWNNDGTPTTAADWLAGLNLADIFQLNTNATFQDNIFFAAPVPAPAAASLAGLAGLTAARRRRRP